MEQSKPKPNHKAIGELSQIHIIASLLEAGYRILTPYGDNARYDLVIEDAEGKFWRVQCKTGWTDEKKSVIKFATASSYNHTVKNKVWKNYRGECEFFAVYCAETKGVYLIPVEEVGLTQAQLRLTPTVNNQEKGIRWAKDYEL
jgi:hypothetical protein